VLTTVAEVLSPIVPFHAMARGQRPVAQQLHQN
jgi:hypothetical protein